MKKPVTARPTITITINERAVGVPEGCSVALALLVSGVDHTRHTTLGNEPRGVLCGMGSCYDCIATIDGVPSVRTCITEAVDGMVITTGPDGAQR